MLLNGVSCEELGRASFSSILNPFSILTQPLHARKILRFESLTFVLVIKDENRTRFPQFLGFSSLPPGPEAGEGVGCEFFQ